MHQLREPPHVPGEVRLPGQQPQPPLGEGEPAPPGGRARPGAPRGRPPAARRSAYVASTSPVAGLTDSNVSRAVPHAGTVGDNRMTCHEPSKSPDRPAMVPAARARNTRVAWARVPDRPYTIVSCAVSLDGYLDDASPERLILSGPEDLDEVDELRAPAPTRSWSARARSAPTTRGCWSATRPGWPPGRRRAGRRTRCGSRVTGTGDLDPAARFFAGPGTPLVYARRRGVRGGRRTWGPGGRHRRGRGTVPRRRAARPLVRTDGAYPPRRRRRRILRDLLAENSPTSCAWRSPRSSWATRRRPGSRFPPVTRTARPTRWPWRTSGASGAKWSRVTGRARARHIDAEADRVFDPHLHSGELRPRATPN